MHDGTKSRPILILGAYLTDSLTAPNAFFGVLYQPYRLDCSYLAGGVAVEAAGTDVAGQRHWLAS